MKTSSRTFFLLTLGLLFCKIERSHAFTMDCEMGGRVVLTSRVYGDDQIVLECLESDCDKISFERYQDGRLHKSIIIPKEALKEQSVRGFDNIYRVTKLESLKAHKDGKVQFDEKLILTGAALYDTATLPIMAASYFIGQKTEVRAARNILRYLNSSKEYRRISEGNYADILRYTNKLLSNTK